MFADNVIHEMIISIWTPWDNPLGPPLNSYPLFSLSINLPVTLHIRSTHTLLYCPSDTIQNLCLDYEGILPNQILWPPVNMII